jgi:predicted negative regulator of RcsB-dependent stress response
MKRQLITLVIGIVIGVLGTLGWNYRSREDVGAQAYRNCFSILNAANQAYRNVGEVDARREWELLAACLYAKAGVR